MSDRDLFAGAADDTHAQMMQATYEALRKHGYSELTIQRIGDEFPKSKSLIYQHYDSKDELLVAFLEYLLEQFEADLPIGDDFDNAKEHLEMLVEYALPAEFDDDHLDFARAVEALRGQAPHDEAYQEQFAATDEFYRRLTADVIREGIEQGVFRDVDPEQAAAFIVASVHGARNQRVTADTDDPIRAARRELERYVQTQLVADEQ